MSAKQTFSIADQSLNAGIKLLQLQVKCLDLLMFILKPLT